MEQESLKEITYAQPAGLIEKRDGGQQIAVGAPQMPSFSAPPPPPPPSPTATVSKPAAKKP